MTADIHLGCREKNRWKMFTHSLLPLPISYLTFSCTKICHFSYCQNIGVSWQIIHFVAQIKKGTDTDLKVLPYLFQCTEGRPGLKPVLWGKSSFRIYSPVPAVPGVVIEVNVTVVGIIRIWGEPTFFNGFKTIGGTRHNKRTTFILLS